MIKTYACGCSETKQPYQDARFIDVTYKCEACLREQGREITAINRETPKRLKSVSVR